MAEIILPATSRPPKGTRAARRLRAEGKIPGVLYGLGKDPVPLAVDWKQLRAALVTEQGVNAVIHLELEGERTPTLVKEIQRHKVRRDVLHVDFIRVDLDKPVEVEVPIVLEGVAEKVETARGVLDQVLVALLVTAKPADIPAQIAVDVSDLDIGGVIRVADIELPAGVTTTVDPDEVVASAYASAVEEGEGEAAEGEAGEGAEAEAPAEGGEAEGGDEG